MWREQSRWDGWLLGFGAVSLIAVATGAAVCAASGVPAGAWGRNLAAWAVGGAAAAGIARAWRPAMAPAALWLAPLGLAATFLSPGMTGVHRWTDLGPLHMNMAMLLLPAAVAALPAAAGPRSVAWGAVLLSLALLAAQPDASQATTLAAVAVLVAAASTPRTGLRAGLIAAAVGAAVVAWSRPDPLAPVPEVEGIVGLALAISPLAGAVAVLSLIAVAAAPVVWTRAGSPEVRLAGVALGLCFLGWAATPLLGAFPVPFVGVGLSPILGAWLGAGVLAGRMRAEQP